MLRAGGRLSLLSLDIHYHRGRGPPGSTCRRLPRAKNTGAVREVTSYGREELPAPAVKGSINVEEYLGRKKTPVKNKRMRRRLCANVVARDFSWSLHQPPLRCGAIHLASHLLYDMEGYTTIVEDIVAMA